MSEGFKNKFSVVEMTAVLNDINYKLHMLSICAANAMHA